MANRRLTIPKSQDIALVAQVNRACPLCATPLFYRKTAGKSQKKYEIAHIYPLNPSPAEIELLEHQERLSVDVNHDHNLIALCEPCHTMFDKPRTVDEYLEIVRIKRELIRKDDQQSLWDQYPIEVDIRHVIDGLYSTLPMQEIELSLHPIEIDRKLTGNIENITKKKIKGHVIDYYEYVKRKMVEMDAKNPGSAMLVASEIRTFYLKQKTISGANQQVIFDDVVAWIGTKTKPKTNDAAEIVTSFFIQNCEIFE